MFAEFSRKMSYLSMSSQFSSSKRFSLSVQISLIRLLRFLVIFTYFKNSRAFSACTIEFGARSSANQRHCINKHMLHVMFFIYSYNMRYEEIVMCSRNFVCRFYSTWQRHETFFLDIPVTGLIVTKCPIFWTSCMPSKSCIPMKGENSVAKMILLNC